MADSSTFVTQRAKVGYRDGAAKVKQDAALFEDAQQPSQTSQSTLLLQKKKLMEEAQSELDRKKEEIRLRMLRCQEKEDALAIVQADLRAQVVKFEKFLKDNDAKRLRAHRKALEEIKQREMKEKEIEILLQQLKTVEEMKQNKGEQLDKIRIYEHFIETVVEHSDEYQEISSVLERFETLAGTNVELKTTIKNSNHEMKEQRDDLAQFVKEAQNQILLSNSSIATHQEQLEEAKTVAKKITQEQTALNNRFREETRLSGEITMSIENLYQRCRIKKRPDADVSLLGRLKAIEEALSDMQDVAKRAEDALENGGVMM
jgi:hypothetical protein